ncbi:hypothetical protein [Burkholderia ubonensis]|uniref:hypothetical protein n=1 Tax=Burkholderia ubonensis TaxID=101571 RepID=UPI0008FE848A|nr:hypothetical protein [Burkholderia ubonensis]OJB09150.1 hypothetical protein BGV48_13975 [Burkholderia ubonensis]
MSLTTDPNDPKLSETRADGQHEKYLVLSEEERAKGFMRPVRESYVHMGKRPKYELRDLTPEEQARYAHFRYVKYEAYPDSESPLCGRFWTEADLNSGCRTVTTMGRALAETYARDPKFYGATFCCRCGAHFTVEEFVWEGTQEAVGS